MTVGIVHNEGVLSDQDWHIGAPASETDVADVPLGVIAHSYHLPVTSIDFLAYADSAARHHRVMSGITQLYEIDQPDGTQPVTLDTTTGADLFYRTSIWLDIDTTDLTDSLAGDSVEVRQGSVRLFVDTNDLPLVILTT